MFFFAVVKTILSNQSKILKANRSCHNTLLKMNSFSASLQRIIFWKEIIRQKFENYFLPKRKNQKVFCTKGSKRNS